jgi:hypothetical protein
MTKYFVFNAVAVVGCWADSEEEAREYLSEDSVDVLSRTSDGATLVLVSDSEPSGERPFSHEVLGDLP